MRIHKFYACTNAKKLYMGIFFCAYMKICNRKNKNCMCRKIELQNLNQYKLAYTFANAERNGLFPNSGEQQ